MPYFDDTQILKTLRENQLFPIYMIFGKENFLSEHCLKRVVEKAAGENPGGFNLRYFDGASLDLAAVRTEVESLPLMATQKCVVVTNPNLEKMAKTDLDVLTELAADPNPATVLILFENRMGWNLKRMAKVKKLAELVAKTGAVVEVAEKTQSELTKLIRQKAGKAGVTITPEAASAMVVRCGSALDTLMNETDKLIAYKPQGELTVRDVELLTHKNLEASVFDLTKAMFQRNDGKAMLILDDLFLNREEPIAIMGALNAAVVDLYRAKLGLLASKGEKELCAVFQYRGREFRIRNALRDVPRYSVGMLRECLRLLAEADWNLKSSRADGKIIVEQTVAAILLLKQTKS